jgi:hypothetical protein
MTTVDGIDTIKAYNYEDLMLVKFLNLVDENIIDKMVLAYLSNWFQLHLGYLHSIINLIIFGFVTIIRYLILQLLTYVKESFPWDTGFKLCHHQPRFLFTIA